MEAEGEEPEPSPKATWDYFSWIVGEEDPEMRAMREKIERYVTQIVAFDRVVEQWHHKKLSKHEAVMHADSVLENICAIGLIDGDALRLRLQRQGFDDARRSELQRSYESLKRECGHRVPHFGSHGTTISVSLCC